MEEETFAWEKEMVVECCFFFWIILFCNKVVIFEQLFWYNFWDKLLFSLFIGQKQQREKKEEKE